MTYQKPYVPKPCLEPWSGMDGDDRKRMCATCDTHVHNLSDMTEREAQALLAVSPDICILYSMDEQGEALYRDSAHPQWRLSLQLQGAQRLVQAAALAIPMLFAACEPAPQTPPEVVSPIVVEEGKAPKVGVSSTPPKPVSVPVAEPVDDVQGLMQRVEPGKELTSEPVLPKTVVEEPVRKESAQNKPTAVRKRPHVVGLNTSQKPSSKTRPRRPHVVGRSKRPSSRPQKIGKMAPRGRGD